jgi:hypothetical protein
MGLFALRPQQFWQLLRRAVAVGVLGAALRIRSAHRSPTLT